MNFFKRSNRLRWELGPKDLPPDKYVQRQPMLAGLENNAYFRALKMIHRIQLFPPVKQLDRMRLDLYLAGVLGEDLAAGMLGSTLAASQVNDRKYHLILTLFLASGAFLGIPGLSGFAAFASGLSVLVYVLDRHDPEWSLMTLALSNRQLTLSSSSMRALAAAIIPFISAILAITALVEVSLDLAPRFPILFGGAVVPLTAAISGMVGTLIGKYACRHTERYKRELAENLLFIVRETAMRVGGGDLRAEDK